MAQFGSSTYGTGQYGSSNPTGTVYQQSFSVQAGSQASVLKNVHKNVQIILTPLPRSPLATFTRGSTAYKKDGSQVSGNSPRYETGRYGQALFVEEGTSNLLNGMNPDLSSWTSGVPDHWSVSASGTGQWSVTQDVLTKLFSPYSAKITASSEEVTLSCGQQGTNLQFDLSGTYTATVWIYVVNYTRGSDNGPHLALQRTDNLQILASANFDSTKLNQWQAVSVTYRGGSTGNAPVQLQFNTRTDGVGVITAYLAGAQVEQKDHATSFTIGTRNDETVLINRVSDLAQGTLELVFSPFETPYQYGRLFEIGQATGTVDDISLWYGQAGGLNTVQLSATNAESGQTFTGSAANPFGLVPGQWYYIAIRWDSTGFRITLYDLTNQSLSTAATGSMSLPFLFPGLLQMYLGTNASGEHSNVLFDDFRLSNIVRSDGELQSVYTSSAPIPVDASTILKSNFDGNIDMQTGIPTSGSGITGVFKSITRTASSIISRLTATVTNALSGGFDDEGLTRFRIITSDGQVYYLSDVEREFDIQHNKISRDQRSGTGRLFRKMKSNKRVFTFKWKWLPWLGSDTVDGGCGAQDLVTIFNKGGSVTLYIPDDPTLGWGDTATCFIDMAGLSVDTEQFIGSKKYWDCSFVLDEI